jgi:phosphoribosylformylglycinamidine synthase subunit PurQ / glutaminase
MPRAPLALVPTGFGINCEAETAHALRLAGAEVEIPHWNDLCARPDRLRDCRILVLAGGFSFGDHLGAGRALANRLTHRLGEPLARFVESGGLLMGICNGFQSLVRLGLLPGGRLGEPEVSLAANRHGTFHDGWVTLTMDPASPCVFTRGLERLEVPVRHGEGQLLCSPTTLDRIHGRHLAPVRYADPATGAPTDRFPDNPNGSLCAIAGLCDASGRVFGLMPHPEAFLYRENHPAWRRRPAPATGLQVFINAVQAARG